MSAPGLVQAAANAHRADIVREMQAQNQRDACRVDGGPLQRLWRSTRHVLHRPAVPVPAPDPATAPLGAITVVGRRYALGAMRVVGFHAEVGGPADPRGRVVHAVSSAGYPACGAERVTHVLLYRVWHDRLVGACPECGVALAGPVTLPERRPRLLATPG